MSTCMMFRFTVNLAHNDDTRTNHKRKKDSTLVPHSDFGLHSPCSRFLPLLLVALLFASCGNGAEPVKTGGIDLSPQWRGQEIVEVREERMELQGPGPFPTGADLEAAANKREREVDVYRDTVLTGTGPVLNALHRRYLSSVLTTDGKSEPTAVDGNSYLITDPLNTCGVQREVKGGTTEASPEEVKKIRLSILRIAASLLPSKKVRKGETWLPGRKLDVLALQGQVDADMSARLKSVEEKEDGKFATITCSTDASIPIGQRIGARLTVRETLLFDLIAGRVTTYHAVTERYYPVGPGRKEGWVKTVTDVSVKIMR